jgi:hypothetical protein
MTSKVVAIFRDGTRVWGLSPHKGIPITSICQHCGATVGQVDFSPAIETAVRRLRIGFCPEHGPDYGVLDADGLWEIPESILTEEFLRLATTTLEAPWKDKLPEHVPDHILPPIPLFHYFTGTPHD